MNFRLFAPGLMGVFLLQGCGNSAITGIPDSKPFAPTAIEKPRSVAHWKTIATETVNYIVEAVPFNSEQGLKLGVYINKPLNPSEFERAYFELLASQLTAKGIPVLTQPRVGALELNYSTQFVVYEGRDGYQPFQASAITASGALLYGASPIPLAAGVAAIAGGEAAVAAAQAHNYTNYESLLSVSLAKEDWLMLSWSKVLSIHDKDTKAYIKPPIYKRVKIDG